VRPPEPSLRVRVRPRRRQEGARERVLLVPPGSTQVLIGRAGDATVSLPFTTVSQRHASLLGDGAGGWTLIDLGSTNGTYVAGHRLTPQVPVQVRTGDLLRVADVELSLEPLEPAAGVGSESTATLARRLVADLFAGGGREVPRLTVADGPAAGRVLELRTSGRPHTIGRASSCDLVVDDADLSREHAAFERRWEGVFVRDLGSKNGVEMNGALIAGETRLRDGARLVLGSTTLILDEPEDRYLAQLAARPDDAPVDTPEMRTPAPAARARPPAASVPLSSTRSIRLAAYLAVTVIAGVTGLTLWLWLGSW
jgi:pSer/pThr/pTyr-binding forkhead associated (FHA) protein